MTRRRQWLELIGRGGLQLVWMIVISSGVWAGTIYGMVELKQRGMLDGLPSGNQVLEWMMPKVTSYGDKLREQRRQKEEADAERLERELSQDVGPGGARPRQLRDVMDEKRESRV
jgi:hypothetical protein